MKGKYLGIAFVVILFSIFIMGFTSAEELTTFDNRKVYDEVTKTATIINTFGIGRTIAEVKLNTDWCLEINNCKVDGVNIILPAGYQKVAEFTINTYDDVYTNPLEKVDFYNLDEYKTIQERATTLDKRFDYKVLIDKPIIVNDYELVCGETLSKNGTAICKNEIIGNHTIYEKEWVNLDKAELTKGEYKIGIFTQVNLYDRVEFIPTYYGVKISEWASYVQSSGTNYTILDGGNNYTVHTFTSSGTFNWTGTDGLNASVLIIGGGGAGGGNANNDKGGCGGGSGGLIFNNSYIITVNLSIVVGNGGIADTDQGTNGGNSSFGTLIAIGGGAGGFGGNTLQEGLDGGSGGGSTRGVGTPRPGGAGLQPTSISGGFGNKGGDGGTSADSGTGGGGSGTAGADVSSNPGGDGGTGKTYTINGTSVCYAGGGGGGTYSGAGFGAGTCGGGAGGETTAQGSAGVNTLGGGGGGSGGNTGARNGNNGGNGIVIVRYLTSDEEIIIPIPKVTLNSPINYYNTTNPTITFNITATDEQRINNVTLYIDGVVNVTDTSNVNGSYQWIRTLSEGSHNWSILAYNNNSKSNQSETRNLSIDSIYPTINITYPLNTTYTDGLITANNVSIWFNWTAIDTNRDKCLVSIDNGATNRTITCNANTSFYSTYGTKTLIAWVNDTFGNTNSSRRTATWSYTLFENSRTIPTTAIEGTTKTFTLNLTAGTPITSAYINYNGTRYSTSINAGTYTIITTTMAIPFVTANGNVTIFWELSGGVNTTSSNMNVTNIAIDNCTTNTIVIYNFTIVDEISQIKLTNTNASLNLQIYPTSSATEIANYTHQYDAVNGFAVCINNTLAVGDSFTIDAEIQYTADNHSSEFYHIQNENLSSSYYRNITLYDLSNTYATIFKIIYRDSTYIAIENALIQIKRKYISEGIFKVSEIPITDYNGETFASLQTNNVVYTFVVIKNGITLDTFSNLFVKCDNILIESCIITLNSVSPYVVPDDFTIGDDFNFDITYNKTSRLLSASFSIPSGNSSTIILNSTLTDNIGTIVACSNTLTSSSGTLSCTIPNGIGNQSVIAYVYKDNVLQGYSIANNKQLASDIYGGSLVFLLLFLYLTLIGISIGDNPMISFIFLIIGAVLGVAINLVNGTFIGRSATILWLIIAVVIVLVKGGKRT